MRFHILIIIWTVLALSTETFSQVNFFDSDDTDYTLSYYETIFGSKIEKIEWEFEGGMIDPQSCNASVIVLFASKQKHWLSMYVRLDDYDNRVDFSDLENIEDEDKKYRLREARFSDWKKEVSSMSIGSARSIIDSILTKGVTNIIIDSVEIPDFYFGDEGELIGVKKGNQTRTFSEKYWYDTRMKVGCNRSEGHGIKYPNRITHGMMDSMIIDSIIKLQHPQCNVGNTNAIWWYDGDGLTHYASFATHFEFIITHFEKVSDYVGCGDVFFAKCYDGNTLAWYLFSSETPQGEFIDIPPDRTIEPTIVYGDSGYDGFGEYVIAYNKKMTGAYFLDKRVFYSFPKGYTLYSNKEYEGTIVKKGKKKLHYYYGSYYEEYQNGTFQPLTEPSR